MELRPSTSARTWGTHYECWNDDWDNDGDGGDWTNFYDGELRLHIRWSCQFIDAGNTRWSGSKSRSSMTHPTTLELDYDICQNMMGCDGDSGEFTFTATAETMSETFYRDRQPDLRRQHLHGLRGDGRVEHLRGHTTTSTSSFTLTYDGVEWEEQWNYQTFDECEDMGDGYECWNDDWDNDGDGEPDWTNFYEEC